MIKPSHALPSSFDSRIKWPELIGGAIDQVRINYSLIGKCVNINFLGMVWKFVGCKHCWGRW